MDKKYYFENPTQVIFADSNEIGQWNTGIAYKDEIICACCGGIFEIDEVIEAGKMAGFKNPIYSYDEWADISYEVTGGEFPSGLGTDEKGNLVEDDF